MIKDSKALEQLPSLPQVLVRILDAIHSDSADFQHIAEIVRQDAAMATRLMAVANSSFYGRSNDCETVERALLFLGTDTVKTIVITASIKQFFRHFNQGQRDFLKQFWRRSLISANFSQVLASLTSYSAPDEAYLCGLLADVGQLMLLTQHESEYLKLFQQANDDTELSAAERQRFNTTHAESGAALVDSWDIPGFMGDAVRYHHERAELIQDAHHLVKIVNLAYLLSARGGISDHAIRQADQLFGLNEALTRELRTRIDSDVEALAQSLGIDIGEDAGEEQDVKAHQMLGQRLSELGQLTQLNTELLRAESLSALNRAVQRTVFMTVGSEHCVLFLLDDGDNTLRAHLKPEAEGEADFQLPLSPGRTLVSDALIEDRVTHSGELEPAALSVVDRQLLHYCRGAGIVCWPLRHRQQAAGVLVIAASENRLSPTAENEFEASLRQEIAAAIADNRRRVNAIKATDLDSAEQYQQRIREAVHEAGNPISIIRNYLEMLRLKLGEKHAAQQDLELLKEEIDRVGAVLLRLKDPAALDDVSDELDVNGIIKNLARIFRESLCASHNVTLNLTLDDELPKLSGSGTHLQQILTNLIKNAVEASPEGSAVTVSSEAGVSVNGRDYAAVVVSDQGAGLPPQVRKNLFRPVTSTKGGEHAGLGLSIVKRLVDEMNGSIVCKSGGKGTQFQLLLPK